MRRTKDQRDLEQILAYSTEARDVAYGLFRRRLDTQRNVNSFVLLRDAYVRMQEACEFIEEAIKQATETKSSDQLSVMDEIMVRSGRARVVTEDESKARGPAEILPFPGTKKEG